MGPQTVQRSHSDGYLAVPHSGRGRGVLVLHAWWGLSEAIKEVCNRLADEGFVAFAPDLYHGKLAATIEEAEALSEQLEVESAKADITEAVKNLLARAEPGLGVLGFSLGAYFALQLSYDDPQHAEAVVLFYGSGDADFSRAKAAYLGHFAETDPYEPAENVDWLENALRSAGRPVTFHRYEGTGHWFCEPDRPEAYNEAAARLAWERTVTFLKERV